MMTTKHAAADRTGPILMDRRKILHGLGLAAAGGLASAPASAAPTVVTGAAALAAANFAPLKGKRIGLVTNQTGQVGGDHLADLLSRRTDMKLAAILALARRNVLKALNMGPMTMMFVAKDKAQLDGLKVGDKVKFRPLNEAGKMSAAEIRVVK